MAGRKAQAISNYCTRHGVEFEVEEYLRILEEAHVDLVVNADVCTTVRDVQALLERSEVQTEYIPADRAALSAGLALDLSTVDEAERLGALSLPQLRMAEALYRRENEMPLGRWISEQLPLIDGTKEMLNAEVAEEVDDYIQEIICTFQLSAEAVPMLEGLKVEALQHVACNLKEAIANASTEDEPATESLRRLLCAAKPPFQAPPSSWRGQRIDSDEENDAPGGVTQTREANDGGGVKLVPGKKYSGKPRQLLPVSSCVPASSSYGSFP